MSDRAFDIIGLFRQEHKPLRTDELAARLDVGTRSVRRYIKQANSLLSGIALIEPTHPGVYELKVIDEKALEHIHSVSPRSTGVPDSPEERVSYLLGDLLSRSDWVTLDTLSQALYVSRRTVSSDLRTVELTLTRYGLELESRPYRGIRISGEEAQKRLCFADTFFQSALDSRGASAFGVTMESVQACVDSVLQDSQLTFSSINYRNLIVHVAVAIMRIRAHAYIPMEGSSLEEIADTPEYAAAEAVARELARQFAVDLPREEIAYIALHFAGKRMSWDRLPSLPEEDPSPLISEEVWQIVAEMIEEVWQVYQLDFRDDLELRMNLACHVVPLAVRLQYHMVAKNPLTEEIKARYPLAWSMAVDGSRVLERHYGSSLKAPEIGYLALAFALAIERSDDDPPKKNVLVVCASGAGTARLLEYRCRKEFGAYVDTITTCDASQIAHMDFSNIDYVFTTVPLTTPVPVPVREVSVFLDQSDVVGIIELLRREDSGGLIRYFPRELFFAHVHEATKEGILTFLANAAIERVHLPEVFRDLVFEREKIAPTSFGNRVALPHPACAVSCAPFVAVGLLDQPVSWGVHEVQAVFLISFSNDPTFNPDEFNSGIAALLSSESAIDRLLEERKYETLQELMGLGGELSQ